MRRTRSPNSSFQCFYLALTLASFVTASAGQLGSSEFKPPVAKKAQKTSELHGDRLVDDYFWLREKANPEVAAYLEAENAYTDAVMKPTEALQKKLYDEMLGRIKQTDLSVPHRDRGYFCYSRTEEGKQYPIFCRKKGSLDAAEQITLDPNEVGKPYKFFSIGTHEVSDDGRLLAYTVDPTGFRQYTLQVKNLDTGDHLTELAERVGSVEWAADSKTVFYTVEDDAKRQYRLYQHRIGSKADDDNLIYEEKDERFDVSIGRSRSLEYLFLSSDSQTTTEVRYLRADSPTGEWQTILPREPEIEYEVDHRGDRFFIRINDVSRNFRLVSAPIADPRKANWVEFVPHRNDVMLEGADFFAQHYVMREREGGLPRLSVTDLHDGRSHRIEFPEPTYSIFAAANPEFDTTTFRYNYQSLVTPNSVYDYDMNGRKATLLKRTEVLGGFDPSRYQTEWIHARAADGVRIPISLVHKKGLPRDGSAPMFLDGYGSYGIPNSVTFSSNDLSLLDRGVIVGTAHIRGGGELGKPWHDAGRMKNKKNTFTDFIAAAEHLIAEKYTSRDRLAIQGGSAGGLLMGAVTNMRPDLFKAVVSKVPFVDVINTMSDASLPLTVTEFEEWGNPEVKEEYEYIKTYCPYTNLARKAYPATLVKTSFNDSQVMYWEPAKYVAKLRTLKTDPNPLLLKTNMSGGHGGSSGRYDRLKEDAFDYAFVITQLGVKN